MRTDCSLDYSCSRASFSSSCPRSHTACPATLHLPAATLRLLRGWRAPSSGLRVRWMALEAAGANHVPCALRQPPVSELAVALADKFPINVHVARASAYSTASSASSARASAVAEAATAPQHGVQSAAARLADSDATGREHSGRQRSAQTVGQLPRSHSPALQFEVS